MKDNLLENKHLKQMYKIHKAFETFINNFEKSQRGGVHDILESSLFRLLNRASNDIFNFLEKNKEIGLRETLTLVLNSYKKEIDVLAKEIDYSCLDFKMSVKKIH